LLPQFNNGNGASAVEAEKREATDSERLDEIHFAQLTPNPEVR
jgi:hypothetical protein